MKGIARRCLHLFLILAGGLFLWAILGQNDWQNHDLDLPFNGRQRSVEEEHAPEIISFYGQQFEADVFVYVIDRSGSMAQGELLIAKQQVSRNVQEFSDRVHFGIVFFESGITRFPAHGAPREATVATKTAALAFIKNVLPGTWTCVKEALLCGLRMAKVAAPKRKTLIYVSDGGGTCRFADDDLEKAYLKETLELITRANAQEVKINCIGILNPKPMGEKFMQELANKNGGRYTRICK